VGDSTPPEEKKCKHPLKEVGVLEIR